MSNLSDKRKINTAGTGVGNPDRLKSCVIGVDGGGTNTTAVLVDFSGVVIEQTGWGSTNYQALGGERLKKEIIALLDQIRKESGIGTEDVKKIVLGLSGAGRKRDREEIIGLFEETRYAGKMTVESDAFIALMGAFATRPGIILIAGTGSICYGKRQDGEVIRSGGWGYRLGDEGSGYAMGRDAINFALKDLDGRGDPTSLRRVLEHTFNLERIDEIIPLIYQDRIDRIRIANLAPIVFDEAETGDSVAQNIVKQTGRSLGQLVGAVVQRLKLQEDDVQIALIGGLFKRKGALMPGIQDTLQGVTRSVSFIEPEFKPPIGAVLTALELCGLSIDDILFQRLKESQELSF